MRTVRIALKSYKLQWDCLTYLTLNGVHRVERGPSVCQFPGTCEKSGGVVFLLHIPLVEDDKPGGGDGQDVVLVGQVSSTGVDDVQVRCPDDVDLVAVQSQVGDVVRHGRQSTVRPRLHHVHAVQRHRLQPPLDVIRTPSQHQQPSIHTPSQHYQPSLDVIGNSINHREMYMTCSSPCPNHCDHGVSDAWRVRCQTYGYLTRRIALPLTLGRYSFPILLGRRLSWLK